MSRMRLFGESPEYIEYYHQESRFQDQFRTVEMLNSLNMKDRETLTRIASFLETDSKREFSYFRGRNYHTWYDSNIFDRMSEYDKLQYAAKETAIECSHLDINTLYCCPKASCKVESNYSTKAVLNGINGHFGDRYTLFDSRAYTSNFRCYFPHGSRYSTICISGTYSEQDLKTICWYFNRGGYILTNIRNIGGNIVYQFDSEFQESNNSKPHIGSKVYALIPENKFHRKANVEGSLDYCAGRRFKTPLERNFLFVSNNQDKFISYLRDKNLKGKFRVMEMDVQLSDKFYWDSSTPQAIFCYNTIPFERLNQINTLSI